MTVLKFIRVGLIALIALMIILVIVLLIYHQHQLKRESEVYPAPGRMVPVNKNPLHVCAYGDGPQTLVFMAGHGTSNPLLDFKPLWSRLSDSYRVVIVEKSGYGWSPVSSSSRRLDIMLEETRQALQLAGETGPFVLVPHSMSGLEAIYWAQKYPGEVAAITALDPAVPETVAAMPEPPKGQLSSLFVISRLGLSRFMPDEEAEKALPLLKTDAFSEEDRKAYMAIFYKSAFTKNMLKEVDYLQENAKEILSNELPTNTPMYFFISDGQEVPGLGWRELLSNYVSQFNMGEYKYLDCGHYVHNKKPDLIANEMKAFIKKISSN